MMKCVKFEVTVKELVKDGNKYHFCRTKDKKGNYHDIYFTKQVDVVPFDKIKDGTITAFDIVVPYGKFNIVEDKYAPIWVKQVVKFTPKTYIKVSDYFDVEEHEEEPVEVSTEVNLEDLPF